MKARIKKTGEILKVAEYARITMENCDSYGNPLEYKPEEVEFIDETTTINNINWEQRKEELKNVLKEMFRSGEIKIVPVAKRYAYSVSVNRELLVIIDNEAITTVSEKTEFS